MDLYLTQKRVLVAGGSEGIEHDRTLKSESS